jgi:hypothetical protein
MVYCSQSSLRDSKPTLLREISQSLHSPLFCHNAQLIIVCSSANGEVMWSVSNMSLIGGCGLHDIHSATVLPGLLRVHPELPALIGQFPAHLQDLDHQLRLLPLMADFRTTANMTTRVVVADTFPTIANAIADCVVA